MKTKGKVTVTFEQLKRLIKESSGAEFKKIIKAAYPWIDRNIQDIIYRTYDSEGWFPDDVDELKEDIHDILVARCSEFRAKMVLKAIEPPKDEPEDDEEIEELDSDEDFEVIDDKE